MTFPRVRGQETRGGTGMVPAPNARRCENFRRSLREAPALRVPRRWKRRAIIRRPSGEERSIQLRVAYGFHRLRSYAPVTYVNAVRPPCTKVTYPKSGLRAMMSLHPEASLTRK